eukprot:COSAG02_NODE_428_length_22489_cov_4.690219_16_plen_159_part_00
MTSFVDPGAEKQARHAHTDHLAKTRSARDAERTRLPPYWTPIGPQWNGEKTLRVLLQSDSHEFKSIASKFHSTCHPDRYAIDAIWRVQNFDQWGMFLNQMKRMRARKSKDRSDPGANMQELFHGTDEVTIEKIVEYNFNRSFNQVSTAYATIRSPPPK